MVVVLRLLDVAAVSWAADHSLAAANVDTALIQLEAPIADCTAPDIGESATIAASPNSAAHID